MQAFFNSPFASDTVAEKNNPVLLLLFILKELFKNPQIAIDEYPINSGPFGWSMSSSIQKLREYFSLLPIAFPELVVKAPSLTNGISIQELFTQLEPFIMACGANENLLLFLLRHQKELAVKPLLDRICPEGPQEIKNKICEGFNKRGYYFRRWTYSPKNSSTTQ